ncbi:MAG: hypothetical protein PF482_00860 [Desulfobacteraceae bacterium]|jgi:hypothetical protein|nr:hypothetical protein [Desulfobacteraceae bacterium]
MSSFKNIGDSETVNSKYSGRSIVYLESQEDCQIFFERWFYDEGEFLEFRSSDMGCGGGCTNVIKNVENDRQNGILSFGIVDRDTLMQQNKWPELWETDDQQYKKLRPFGENIRPLCRWEIENYLLDIDEIECLLADIGKGSPRAIRDKILVIKEFLDHCEALIPIMANNMLLHQKGKKSPELCFCVQDARREDTEKVIQKQIIDEDKMKYEDIVLSIEAFKHNIADITEESFYKINRILDGKRFIERLKNHNLLGSDFRFMLARKIKEKNKIDDEIIEIIEEFKV